MPLDSSSSVVSAVDPPASVGNPVVDGTFLDKGQLQSLDGYPEDDKLAFSGFQNGSRRHPTPDEDLIRRVRTRRDSIPSRVELVRQGAALTDSQLAMMKKKGDFIDSMTGVSAMGNMARIHTDVVDSLTLASSKLLQVQANLMLQALSTAVTICKGDNAGIDAAAASQGESSTGLGRLNPGQKLAKQALESLTRLFSGSQGDALDRIVNAADRIVAASAHQSAFSIPISQTFRDDDDLQSRLSELSDRSSFAEAPVAGRPTNLVNEFLPI
ncbi:hypothetical protein RHS04_06412 [Rhizoctonia solani]|uniref:Uncharacterized protein n=1 Tax=Rhizoctonia solani TaxID=456999 RepID=A0A8H7LHJ6_9AGAM|nr:hypothetical protein RHS04_06412 [Rhizoctonia solani]